MEPVYMEGSGDLVPGQQDMVQVGGMGHHPPPEPSSEVCRGSEQAACSAAALPQWNH